MLQRRAHSGQLERKEAAECAKEERKKTIAELDDRVWSFGRESLSSHALPALTKALSSLGGRGALLKFR